MVARLVLAGVGLLVASVALAGCGPGAAGNQAVPGAPPSTVVPSPSPTTPSAPARRGCQASATVRVAAEAAPTTVCVPVDGRLRFAAAPGENWPAPVSSDPRILSCTTGSGLAEATCVPHLPGTATVSTTGGPPATSVRWELRVNVIAEGLI